MVKRIYKYATGAEVPEGAEYLCTIKNGFMRQPDNGVTPMPKDYCYVWHYFLVDVE